MEIDPQAADPARPSLPPGCRLEPTPAAADGAMAWPMFQLEDPQVWKSLPRIPWALAGRPKPGAAVLATAAGAGADGEGPPQAVMAAQPYGLGKVFWVGTDGDLAVALPRRGPPSSSVLGPAHPVGGRLEQADGRQRRGPVRPDPLADPGGRDGPDPGPGLRRGDGNARRADPGREDPACRPGRPAIPPARSSSPSGPCPGSRGSSRARRRWPIPALTGSASRRLACRKCLPWNDKEPIVRSSRPPRGHPAADVGTDRPGRIPHRSRPPGGRDGRGSVHRAPGRPDPRITSPPRPDLPHPPRPPPDPLGPPGGHARPPRGAHTRVARIAAGSDDPDDERSRTPRLLSSIMFDGMGEVMLFTGLLLDVWRAGTSRSS